MTSQMVTRALPAAEDRAAADMRMRALLSRPDPGPVAEHLALLHFTGRHSGRPYVVPAGVHLLDDGGLVVATGSGWRHNFAGGTDGELTWRGTRAPALFTLMTDADRIATGYLELYKRYGAEAGLRRLGLAVAEGDTPDLADFRAAVDHCGLALVDVLTSAVAHDPATSRMNEGTSR